MRTGAKGMAVRCAGAMALCAALAMSHGCAGRRAAAPRPPGKGEAARGAEDGELRALQGIIERAVERYERVNGYRCTFSKRQRIGGALQEMQTIRFAFMKPMNLYMKWLSEPHKGQEILYAPARYGKRALARAGGWKGALTPAIPIDIDGYWVMRDNLHPLDHAGIGYFLKIFMENSRRAREEKASALIDRGTETVGGRRARVLESVLPADRSRGYYCYRCVVWFDGENGLPVKIMIYDWDDNLAEEYRYEDLELEPGLTEKDFDRHNPAYRF